MVRFVALAAAVLSSAVLLGCGAADPERVDPNTVSRNAARLDTLHRRINGSVEERVAGERVAYQKLHEPVRACMAAAKLPYFPPPFVNIYAGTKDSDLTVGFPGEGWLAPVSEESFGIAAGQLRLSAAQPGEVALPPEYENLSPAEKDRYQQTEDACERPATGDANVAPGAAQLSEVLDGALAAVESRSPIKDLTGAYPGCMKSAGFPDIANPAKLAETLTRGFPSPDVMPLGGRPAGPEWEAVVTRERKAAKADSNCRRAIYEQAMAAVGPDLDRFEADHATELADVRRGWTELVAAAAKLPA